MTTVNRFDEAVKDARHYMGMVEAISGWAHVSIHANKTRATVSARENLRLMNKAVSKARTYIVTPDDLCIVDRLNRSIGSLDLAVRALTA